MTKLKLAALAAATTLLVLAAAPAAADEGAPMPQTRGMQGMDPRLHDQPAQHPYAGCVPNAAKAAHQAAHPMPQTRGMQGMDPRAHTLDCPPAAVAKVGAQVHVHKTPAN